MRKLIVISLMTISVMVIISLEQKLFAQVSNQSSETKKNKFLPGQPMLIDLKSYDLGNDSTIYSVTTTNREKFKITYNHFLQYSPSGPFGDTIKVTAHTKNGSLVNSINFKFSDITNSHPHSDKNAEKSTLKLASTVRLADNVYRKTE